VTVYLHGILTASLKWNVASEGKKLAKYKVAVTGPQHFLVLVSLPLFFTPPVFLSLSCTPAYLLMP